MNGAIVALTSLAVGSAVAAAGIYGDAQKNKVTNALYKKPAYKVHGPLVSVVIPTLREEDYLGLLLTSVYNQTYAPLEVVVSDSSPPESKAATQYVIDKWKPFLNVRMVNSPAKNVSRGRNVGAAAADGRALLFVDADCILDREYVHKLADALSKGAVLAHGIDCWYDNDFHNTLKSFYSWFKPRLHTTGRGVLIRKEHFRSLGGYREDYDPAATGFREDLDLGRRVERTFGSGSVCLVQDAVVGESDRRPLFSSTAQQVWKERGWRKGKPITYLPLVRN